MHDKVSVIVTVFNKVDTIQRCLESLNKQNFKDIRVFVIDDGSTDNSSEIAKEFCEQHERFVYYHQNNQGVSSARNFGLRLATGDFVFFVDGDDYIDDNYIQTFMLYSDYDLVVGGYKQFLQNNSIIKTVKPPKKRFMFQSWNTFFDENTFEYIGLPVSKMFKSEIIKKYNLQFDEQKDFGEDTIFVFKYLSKCRMIQYISYAGYDNDIYLTNTLSRKARDDSWEVNFNLVKSLSQVIDCGFDKNWTFLFMRAISLALRSSKDDTSSFRKTWLKIKQNKQFKELKFRNITSDNKRILYLLLLLNAQKITYKIYKNKRKSR